MEVPPEQRSCPSPDDVAPKDLSLDNGACGHEIIEINGEGKRTERTIDYVPNGGSRTFPACCYPVTVEDNSDTTGCAVPGRPYYDHGEPRSAPLLARGVPPAVSARRAAAWAKAGAGEHASVASFSRLVLELMALGAPAALLSEAHRAALDEIRHAETCWGFAKSLGLDVQAGAFPFVGRLELDVTLDAFASATVRDGCVAETLGAHLLAAAAALAPEAAVKSALEQMAREEARHAVFAFRIVAWALARGGPSVRASVRDALASARFEPDLDELAVRAQVDVARLRAALNEGVEDVIQPAIAALLAA
jgi:hypothetical protein